MSSPASRPLPETLVVPHRRPGPMLRGILRARPNRFLGVVELPGGETVEAHIADRGRLTEILFPGAAVFLVPAEGPTRRTAYTLVCAEAPPADTLVCLDPAGANRLVRALLDARALPLPAYGDIRPEFRVGNSRFDFRLALEAGGALLLEVKSAAAAADGCALFPDAPSERAARHCLELAEVARAGQPAAIVLVAQRGDVGAIAPHPVDPAFAVALREAAQAGVRLLGVCFSVSPEGFHYRGEIPVRLDAPRSGQGPQ